MSAKTNRVNLNLGTSSLLLIFVVLSLVSFSALSLSSALSDKNLTDKTVEKNQTYYDACNMAQERLALIDRQISDIYLKSDNKDSYLEACSSLELTYVVPCGEYQGLQVKVTPTYPVEENDHFFKIDTWKLIFISEPEPDFSINILK